MARDMNTNPMTVDHSTDDESTPNQKTLAQGAKWCRFHIRWGFFLRDPSIQPVIMIIL